MKKKGIVRYETVVDTPLFPSIINTDDEAIGYLFLGSNTYLGVSGDEIVYYSTYISGARERVSSYLSADEFYLQDDPYIRVDESSGRTALYWQMKNGYMVVLAHTLGAAQWYEYIIESIIFVKDIDHLKFEKDKESSIEIAISQEENFFAETTHLDDYYEGVISITEDIASEYEDSPFTVSMFNEAISRSNWRDNGLFSAYFRENYSETGSWRYTGTIFGNLDPNPYDYSGYDVYCVIDGGKTEWYVVPYSEYVAVPLVYEYDAENNRISLVFRMNV